MEQLSLKLIDSAEMDSPEIADEFLINYEDIEKTQVEETEY